MIDESKYVLVVDDFATMRKIIVACLKFNGFSNVLEADDGKKALAIVEARGSDITLVVSDWNMPNMDGLELLKSIRFKSKYPKLPVMMITAEAQKDNIIDAVKYGANAYIVKPFTPEIFAEKIKKLKAMQ